MNDAVLTQWNTGIQPWRHQIVRTILFGSRARGDAKPASDYDLLLIVPSHDRTLIDHCYDVVMDILLATGRLVSLKFFTPAEFTRLMNLRTPFMQHIAAEGLDLG